MSRKPVPALKGSTMSWDFRFGGSQSPQALTSEVPKATADETSEKMTDTEASLSSSDEEKYSQSPTIEKLCVLGIADDTSDVILEVEGRQLHANRAVLAHYSPVFRKMFFSDFKEKEVAKVPLPGKSYDQMAKFFNVLYPQSPTSPKLISDEDLVTLLTLADEYQADQVKARCQDYIGEQLSEHYRRKYVAPQETVADATPWVDRLTLFLWMCDEYDLPRYRAEVMSLLVKAIGCLDDVAMGVHYSSLPLQSRADLLEALCRKLDGSYRGNQQRK